ncbi:unnamed protein product [Symbiodinium microadriaticum]|nr:unnamed protein product [Symbiodinium microadriaticum]
MTTLSLILGADANSDEGRAQLLSQSPGFTGAVTHARDLLARARARVVGDGAARHALHVPERHTYAVGGREACSAAHAPVLPSSLIIQRAVAANVAFGAAQGLAAGGDEGARRQATARVDLMPLYIDHAIAQLEDYRDREDPEAAAEALGAALRLSGIGPPGVHDLDQEIEDVGYALFTGLCGTAHLGVTDVESAIERHVNECRRCCDDFLGQCRAGLQTVTGAALREHSVASQAEGLGEPAGVALTDHWLEIVEKTRLGAMALLRSFMIFVGAAFFWDELIPTPIRSAIFACKHYECGKQLMTFAAASHLPVTIAAVTSLQVSAPESTRFGSWPPRWFLDAVNLGHAMMRDGARAPELMLALISTISGRGVPGYTAYATSIVSDITPEQIPTEPGNSRASMPSLTLQGCMAAYRVEDWVTYVEYNILLEYLTETFLRYVHMWNAQTAGGADPTSPIRPWTMDTAGLDIFNALIAQGPGGRPPAEQPLPARSWSQQIVEDVHRFHRQGYRVQGLIQAIGTYVDSRGYGSDTNWAHRQLHLAWSMTYNLHNTTTSVPPSSFNQWEKPLVKMGERKQARGVSGPDLLGLPSTAALPALPGETEADAAQRARYNQVRQPPALLQQWRTLTQPQAPTDPRGHYLSWTGEVVQQVYDYYEAGYHTAAAIPLLTHFVQQRRFAEYTEGATYYIDRTADQLGDYVGSCWTSPEGMAEWARHMEQELWEAFVLHGLDLRYADRQCLLFILGRRGRRRGTPRRDAGRTGSTTERRSRSPHCTRETRNLAEIAAAVRARAHQRTTCPSNPRRERQPREPAHAPPGSATRPPASRPHRDHPDEAPIAPMTLDMAVDTWLLVLGVRNIDEEIGPSMLPESTMANIGETFHGHDSTDRLTLMLALHRLVLGLLSAMGDAIQAASPPSSASRGDQMDTVRVDEEDEDDQSVWMQMPMENDWYPLLQALIVDLEKQAKITQRRAAEWLLDWLGHRCTNSKAGYFLGHMGGRPGELTAVLATFSGDQNDEGWATCTDEEVAYGMEWAQRLQPYLALHPGSRQARGLPPTRSPVMLSPKEIPDDLLYDSPVQDLHGDLPASQLDRAIEVNSSGQPPLQNESQNTRDEALVDYLTGLHTPSSIGPPRKSRAVMIELSSGSGDAPTRVVRLPADDQGHVRLHLNIWTEDEVDQDGIATRLLPQALETSTGPAVEPAHTEGADGRPVDHGIPDLQVVRDLAAAADIDEDYIRATYGLEVLAMVQSARAVTMPADTQLEGSLQTSSDVIPVAEHHVSVEMATGLRPEGDASSSSGVWRRRFEGDTGAQ